MTPEEARSWLIEQGELTVGEAAEATKVTAAQREQVERNGQRSDWVGKISRRDP